MVPKIKASYFSRTVTKTSFTEGLKLFLKTFNFVNIFAPTAGDHLSLLCQGARQGESNVKEISGKKEVVKTCLYFPWEQMGIGLKVCE